MYCHSFLQNVTSCTVSEYDLRTEIEAKTVRERLKRLCKAIRKLMVTSHCILSFYGTAPFKHEIKEIIFG